MISDATCNCAAIFCRRRAVAAAAELEPGFASAWFALGDLREQMGQRDDAVSAYLRARDADPDDRHGAKLRLMRLGVEDLSAMPPGYVRALFDQYAPRFDKTLVNDLDYRGPAVLLKAVLAARHAANCRCLSSARLILDAGPALSRGSSPHSLTNLSVSIVVPV